MQGRYLQQCEQYGLLPESVQRQWDSLREDPLQSQEKDPTTKRADKIARFKASRAAKARLDALQVLKPPCRLLAL